MPDGNPQPTRVVVSAIHHSGFHPRDPQSECPLPRDSWHKKSCELSLFPYGISLEIPWTKNTHDTLVPSFYRLPGNFFVYVPNDIRDCSPRQDPMLKFVTCYLLDSQLLQTFNKKLTNMASQNYSLDQEIADFFNKTSTSQSSCDTKAQTGTSWRNCYTCGNTRCPQLFSLCRVNPWVCGSFSIKISWTKDRNIKSRLPHL